MPEDFIDRAVALLQLEWTLYRLAPLLGLLRQSKDLF